MKKFILPLLVVVLLSAFTLNAPVINSSKQTTKNLKENLNGGRILTAELFGSNEVPNAGDPDGSGYAEIVLNQGQGTITYSLMVEGIVAASAAHIHFAPAGVAGGVVVALSAPSSGMSSGTVNVDPELIKAIRKNPEAYYVNVHNSVHPGGALRGQLSK